MSIEGTDGISMTRLQELLQKHGFNDPSEDVNQQNHLGQTLLHHACSRSCENPEIIEIVQLLLANPHVEINHPDTDGDTPFHEACYRNQLDVVQLFLEHPRVEVNQQNKKEQTPLHNACSDGNVALVTLLLQEPRVNANQHGRCGQTALHQACSLGHTEVAKLLLADPRVEINSLDLLFLGTPLHHACGSAHREVVKLLLADPFIAFQMRDKENKTPLEILQIYPKRMNLEEDSVKQVVSLFASLYYYRGIKPPVACEESPDSKKWLREKVQPMDAAWYFSWGGVLPCDDYYTLQEEEPENPEHKKIWRFCKMLQQLLIECVREIAALEWRRVQQEDPERSL
jgi:hypothetical protein